MLSESRYPDDARIASSKANEITNFAERMEAGDVVLAVEGFKVLGVGKVQGPYRFDNTDPSLWLSPRRNCWNANGGSQVGSKINRHV